MCICARPLSPISAAIDIKLCLGGNISVVLVVFRCVRCDRCVRCVSFSSFICSIVCTFQVCMCVFVWARSRHMLCVFCWRNIYHLVVHLFSRRRMHWMWTLIAACRVGILVCLFRFSSSFLFFFFFSFCDLVALVTLCVTLIGSVRSYVFIINNKRQKL